VCDGQSRHRKSHPSGSRSLAFGSPSWASTDIPLLLETPAAGTNPCKETNHLFTRSIAVSFGILECTAALARSFALSIADQTTVGLFCCMCLYRFLLHRYWHPRANLSFPQWPTPNPLVRHRKGHSDQHPRLQSTSRLRGHRLRFNISLQQINHRLVSQAQPPALCLVIM
jgi:hypothetical protein